MRPTDDSSAMRTVARNKFLAACSLAGAATTTHRNPNPEDQSGDECWIDVARLGSPDAPSVLVLACSLNGDEGFCGSTVMTDWLASGHQRDVPRDVGLIMLHAILPPSYAAGSAPAPDASARRSWSDTVLSAAAQRFASYTERTGKSNASDTNPSAQADTDTGWMKAASDAIVDEIIEHARNVALLEFHTGLRPRGDSAVASCHASASEANGRLKSWFGEKVETEDPAILDIFSLGFGTRLSELTLTAAHIEFGVYSFGGLLNLEASKNSAKRHAAVRSLFLPESEDWRTQVSSEGVRFIGQALAGLGKT